MKTGTQSTTGSYRLDRGISERRLGRRLPDDERRHERGQLGLHSIHKPTRRVNEREELRTIREASSLR